MESAAGVDTVKAAGAVVKAAHATIVGELKLARATLRTKEEIVDQLRQELAAAIATNTSIDGRLDDLQRQVAHVQSCTDQQIAAHLAEREKFDERTLLAEQRFAEMEKRALLGKDRDCAVAAKLQKTLESERDIHARSLNRLRVERAAI